MPFTEVADRVWVARYPTYDVNVSLVAGDAGAVLVDTNASAELAREVLADLGRVWTGPLVAVVNTHDHFDHVLGNPEVRVRHPGIPIHAHEAAAVDTADRTFSSATVLDLGDRQLELVHPGRGHTAGDLVVRVPDADVLLAGDLVEESAVRDGVPSFGDDCYPLEWPWSLDVVLGLTTSRSVVVPGHGTPVDRDFVEEQRNAIGIVATTIRELAGRGVRVEQALETGEWPFPVTELGDAVRRGYAQLPPGQRRLPLA